MNLQESAWRAIIEEKNRYGSKETSSDDPKKIHSIRIITFKKYKKGRNRRKCETKLVKFSFNTFFLFFNNSLF